MKYIKPVLIGIATFVIVLYGSILITYNMNSDNTLLYAISIACGITIACSIWIVDTIKEEIKKR